MPFGCLLGGFLMQKYGRKMAHFILNVPFVVGWVMIALSKNLLCLLIGRFLTGLCVGLLGPPVPVYIGETSDPKYRGLFLGAVTLAVSLGILLAHLFGTLLTWQMTAVLCGLFPFVSYIIITFVPESPSWLIAKGRIQEASEAFVWLRGYSAEAYKEFENMIAAQQKIKDANNADNRRSLRDTIVLKAFYKPLVILLVFFGAMQFSGLNAVVFYTVEILKTSLGEDINEYAATLSIDCVRVIISVIACVVIKKSGRRALTAISGFGTAITLLLLALYLYLTNDSASNVSWVPLLLFVSYVVFITIGLNPLPWCMTGELFPLRFRATGSAIVTFFNFFCVFVVVKTKTTLFAYLRPEGAYTVYGIITAAGIIILCIYLPETKNKSLQEIEDTYTRTNASKKNGSIDTQL